MAEETVKLEVTYDPQLPTKRLPVVSISPKRTLIYSIPKGGKTTIVAGLDDCLLVDLEEGSEAVEAMRVQAKNVNELRAICNKIQITGTKYKYLAVDTVTALEAMCIPLAGRIYKATPQGKNFDTSKNVLHLADGAGYTYLREAFEMMLKMLQESCERLILLGHVKDKYLAKAGAEVISKDIDLTGKLKNITCANADAIGYLYRKGKDTVLTFITTDDVICGARPAHLRNQEFVVATEQPDKSIKVDWSKIFID